MRVKLKKGSQVVEVFEEQAEGLINQGYKLVKENKTESKIKEVKKDG